MTEEHRDRELHPSEVAKNEAEAAKTLIEAQAAQAEAEANVRKAEAEARKLAAEAALEELKLTAAGFDRDVAVYKREKELAGDEYHFHYKFHGGVDGSSCAKLADQLKVWERLHDPQPVTIEMFSPGGSVFPGLALLDNIVSMRKRGWHFTITTRGYAASMGGILLQAADVRVIGSESYILIHEISAGAMGKIGEMEDEIEFLQLVQKRVNDLFARRSGGKVTPAKLRAMYRRKDFWLDSDQALRLGIVDEIDAEDVL